MIVSLEAIFLSTFVMISQNRADGKRQVIADQQWQTVKEEDKQNEQNAARLLQTIALLAFASRIGLRRGGKLLALFDCGLARSAVEAPADEGRRGAHVHRAA